jgi:hypothetical protein
MTQFAVYNQTKEKHMSVKAKLVYFSEDGKSHETRAEAMQHDAMWRSMKGIRTSFEAISPGQSLGTLHIDIVNKPQLAMKLRDQINKAIDVQRRYGKLKKVAAKS